MTTKPLACLASLALVVGSGMCAPSARAAYIMDLTQQGGDVVATGSGTIDLTDLSLLGPEFFPTYVAPDVAQLFVGPSMAAQTAYAGLNGPASFGTGGTTDATSSSGDFVGFAGDLGHLHVPAGYSPARPCRAARYGTVRL